MYPAGTTKALSGYLTAVNISSSPAMPTPPPLIPFTSQVTSIKIHVGLVMSRRLGARDWRGGEDHITHSSLTLMTAVK